MISEEALAKFVASMALMRFFPAGELEREVLARAIYDFVRTDEELDWLRRRVLQLHNEWPGLSEIRAVYCSKFRPRDGIEISSAVYPDGIPSEGPTPAAVKQPMVRRGDSVTADSQLEGMVREAARMKSLPPARGKR